MLAEPYFAAPPPKSTGRELFHREWLDRFEPARFAPADVQATLTALTARSIALAVEHSTRSARRTCSCAAAASTTPR